MVTRALISLIAEGSTEKKVLKALGVPGKFYQFNIWQNDITNLIRQTEKGDLPSFQRTV
ncbi:hypothetical protein DFR44_12331 [Hydromonas duriensis]|uniref:Uncharacterized protein n=1 Tax=Hydromonas duriensis TaxID=1527608 RepID=A0A4R6Y5G1_9BURK|nr:hypothetical protein DFR44_12331 [Hydromonas duriensis]